MKKLVLFVFILFFVISFTNAKAKKLVLLGESRTVDILTVKLSDREDLELFERSQIEQILREHHLSSYGLSPDKIVKHFSHANLIVIISQAGVKKATYPSRITIFNAQNGYKLANTALPPDPLEAAKKAMKIIDMAHDKAAKASLLLSIGIIRNAGVSDKLKYRIAEIVFALSEALVNSDKAQMLERGYLGAVLNERKLSGTTHTLKTSTRMINLEFLPGANAGQIDIVLKLTNPVGKVFFNKKYQAVQKLDKMIKDVCKILKTTPAKTISNNKEEAKRYYNEFKSFFRLFSGSSNALPKNYASVESLLYTMIALDPQNPRYRYEKIFYDLCWIYGRGSSKQKLTILRRYIKDANKFIDQFPNYKYHRYSDGFYGNYPSHVKPLYNLAKQFSDSDQEELSDLIVQIKKINQRNKFGNDPYCLTDSEKNRTVNDLNKYRGTIRIKVDNIPKNDAVLLVRQYYKNDIEIIRVTEAFVKKHPELEKKAKKHYYVSFPYTDMLPKYRQKEAWEEIRKILNRDFAKLKNLYTSTGKAQIINHLNQLQAIRDYLNSDGSKAAFTEVFDAALERAKLRKIEDDIMYFPRLREAAVARGVSQRWTFEICRSRPAMYFIEKGKLAGLPEQERAMLWVRGWIAGKISSKTILKNAASIRKLAYKGICENSAGCLLAELNSTLHFTVDPRPLAKEILNRLNQSFTIRKIKTPFFYCFDAVKWQGKIYMLNALQGYEQAGITRYNPVSGLVDSLPISDADLQGFHSGLKNWRKIFSSTLSFSNKHLLAGGDRKLLLYNLDNGKSRLIKNLPGAMIATAIIINDRIYYLCGGINKTGSSRTLLSMHSCKLDGTDRKTYFSSKRLNKKNKLDKLTYGKVSAFIEVKGKLLFSIWSLNRPGEIYRFDPATEKITTIYQSKQMPAVNLFDHKDFILGQGGQTFGEAFFIMDKQSLKPKWFFTQNMRDKRKVFKYRIPGYCSFGKSVVLVDERYLVCSSNGYGNMFLDLKEPEKSPMLLLPNSCKVIYLDKRKEFIFPVNNNIYVVKLKRDIK